MPDLSGQKLGRYHLVEQIGRGGMAAVYKAFDTRLERYVAIKVIDTLQHDQSFHKRFEREAKSLARLSHTNIVKIHDYGEENEIPYLVMEYLPSGTLKARLGQPIPYQKAAAMLAPIARALDYAHHLGIVHRDIKPANILINDANQPMLSDFGIAKILESTDTAQLTGTGVGIGTPEYMAPEQGQGIGVDQRSDIYSLGVVFYELVTGKTPFKADTPMAIVVKHIMETLPSPLKYIPDLPLKVEQILFKAMAKQPSERYQDMGEFAQELELLAQSTSMPAIVLPAIPEPLGGTSTTYQKRQTETPGIPKKKTSWKLWGGISGAAILLLVAGVIILCMVSFLNSYVSGNSIHIGSTQEAEEAVAQNTFDLEYRVNEERYFFTAKDVGQAVNYTADLGNEEGVIWSLVWCADSKDRLKNNLENMSLDFSINEKTVDQNKLTWSNFNNNDNACAAAYLYLDKWPEGSHNLVQRYTFKTQINDGTEDYPAGTITYNYAVTVHPEKNLAPTSDTQVCLNALDDASKQALSGMQPVLCEPFNRWDNLWSDKTDDDFATSTALIQDGLLSYQVTAKKGVFRHQNLSLNKNLIYETPPTSDFGISLSTRRQGNAKGALIGFFFRKTGGDMYVFEINDTEQTYSAYILLPGEWRAIKEATKFTSIKPGDWNQITMTAKGEQFVFFINGVAAYTFVDKSLSSGDIGFAMEIPDGGASEVFEFDNILLAKPPE